MARVRDGNNQTLAEEIEVIIDHPPYYGSDVGIECIDATRAALGKEKFEAFLQGTVSTYLWRAGKKIGNGALTDVRKAQWYLNRLEASMAGEVS